MQQPQVSFYSSATSTNTAEDSSQVIDAAMTSAVTSLIRSSSNIHSLQQLATAAPTPTPQTTIGQIQQKRKQVKNACTNCQKACKKCDDARPCPRCIKYNIEGTCVNSVRKERKKGIKRGPYKRRQKDEEGSNNNNVSRPRKSVKKDSNNNEKREGEQQEQRTEGAVAAAVAAAATTTSQYEAMRPPNVPYGYPSNLNQYQPYDAAAAAYGQYAAAYHSKDHMMNNPYVSVYHQMGYPVILPGNNSDATATNHHHRNNNEEKQEDEDDDADVKERNDDGNDNSNTDNSNVDDDSKVSKKQANCKQQQSSTSPVPSTSTSPATTSSPESNEDDDATKLQHLQRLTELCTAALTHNNEQQSRTD